MNRGILIVSIFLGIIFLGLAIVYWFIPANSLPSFLPGYLEGSTKVHYKHGLASLVLSFGFFAFYWFRSAKKSSRNK